MDALWCVCWMLPTVSGTEWKWDGDMHTQPKGRRGHPGRGRMRIIPITCDCDHFLIAEIFSRIKKEMSRVHFIIFLFKIGMSFLFSLDTVLFFSSDPHSPRFFKLDPIPLSNEIHPQNGNIDCLLVNRCAVLFYYRFYFSESPRRCFFSFCLASTIWGEI